jgi:hypothetical protein
MSRSFMDSIRSVVTEGAKEKTADGMTKDAKHFRADLHTIKDSGMKHLVQKDSETKDYEKMFNGDVDRAKARLSDQQAPEDLNKYVEYNEEAELEEAKAKEEKHDDDCECEDCTEVNEAATINSPAAREPREKYGSVSAPGGFFRQTRQNNLADRMNQDERIRIAKSRRTTGSLTGDDKFKVAINDPDRQRDANFPAQAAERRARSARMTDAVKAREPQGYTSKGATFTPANPATDPSKTAGSKSPTPPLAKPGGATQQPYGMKPPLAKPGGATQQPYGMKTPSAKPPLAKPGGATQQPYGMKTPSAAAAAKPVSPAAREPGNPPPAQTPRADQIKPKPPKPADPTQRPKKAAPAQPPVSPLKRIEARNKLRNAVGPEAKKLQAQAGGGVTTGKVVTQKPAARPPRGKAARDAVGPGAMNSSFEIEINGTSYLVSEAHASAIAAFVEKYGEVNEVLTKSTTAGEIISDFVHSKNPKFKGDTKKKRIQRALKTYYDKQREK